MFWRADYDDGTFVQEPFPYADIDRTRLVAFSVYEDYLQRVVSVVIPEGGRLIYRRRSYAKPGMDPVATYIIGVESPSQTNVWVVYPEGCGAVITRQIGWGDDVFTARPELLECETV